MSSDAGLAMLSLEQSMGDGDQIRANALKVSTAVIAGDAEAGRAVRLVLADALAGFDEHPTRCALTSRLDGQRRGRCESRPSSIAESYERSATERFAIGSDGTARRQRRVRCLGDRLRPRCASSRSR